MRKEDDALVIVQEKNGIQLVETQTYDWIQKADAVSWKSNDTIVQNNIGNIKRMLG